jgi:hypothetical protein
LGSFGQLFIVLVGEYASFHPSQSHQPPIGGDDSIHKHVLQLSYRLEVGYQVFVQLIQRFFVFSREEDFPREQAVLYGVVADNGLTLRRLRPGALKGVFRLARACLSLVTL